MKTIYAREPGGVWQRFKYDESGKSEVGQEGRVYRASSGNLVIKIFNQNDRAYLAEKHAKIRAMLEPDLLSHFSGKRAQPDFAWPVCTIHKEKSDDGFIGFGMRNLSGYDALAELFSSSSKVGRSFTTE